MTAAQADSCPSMPHSHVVPLDGDTADGAALARALDELLDELLEVIASLSDAQYTQTGGVVTSSCIGAHVRHSFDHVVALVAALRTGGTPLRFDFEQRQRGTEVERDRQAALALGRQLRNDLALLRRSRVATSVALSALPTAAGAPLALASTLGREAMYVISHTIHHNALIAAALRDLGLKPPPRLGLAPSTVRHLEAQACAR